MVQLAQAFDARSVKPSDPDGGSQLSVGNHPVSVTKTEMKPNKDASTGYHAVLTLSAYDGPDKGKSSLYRLNLYHQSSQDAVRIAYEQLSALCHVTGVFNITDLDQLMQKPFIAVVESQNDQQYPNSTQVKGVLDINGDKPGQPGVKGTIRVAAPATATAAPAMQPWSPPGNAAAAPAVATAAPSPAATSFGPASAAPAPVAAPAWTPQTAAPAVAAVAPAAPAWNPNPAANGPGTGAQVPAWATK